MATSDAINTPDNRKTPPPFAQSTSRNSQAWQTAGAAVDFVQEIDEHTSFQSHGQCMALEPGMHASPQSNTTTLQELDRGQGPNDSVQNSGSTQRKLTKERVIKRKQVDYTVNDVEPVKVYSLPTPPQDPDVERLRVTAAFIHPIMNNPIISNSNPRGPRKQKWIAVVRKNLWWFIPLNIIISIGFILYLKYQDDIAKGTDGLRQWLAQRAVWSWSVPTAILILLGCPPFFFIPLISEIMQFLVGLTYPLWIAIGIASLSTLLGDGALFLIFKYAASDWVWKRCEKRPNWAAIARVSQEAGIRGVLMIRFSIIPPSLANPIFATTGMSIWLYMATIIISLPKQIVLVILGFPSTKDDKGAMAAKGIAVTGFIIVTIWGTLWLRGKLRLAKDAIQAERNEVLSDEIRRQVKLATEQLEKDNSRVND